MQGVRIDTDCWRLCPDRIRLYVSVAGFANVSLALDSCVPSHQYKQRKVPFNMSPPNPNKQ